MICFLTSRMDDPGTGRLNPANRFADELRALNRFSDFARSLLAYLFSRYETVSFEADDTDPASTMLRNMFSSANAASWDTYVKYPGETQND